MRRTKLIWFALGAFVASMAFVLAMLLPISPLVLDDSQVPYLIVTEPERELSPGSPIPDEFLIADRTGEIMRQCGAKGFETTFLYNDHRPTAELPIVAENSQALECVVNAIHSEELDFRFENRWSSSVTNEMRSKN